MTTPESLYLLLTAERGRATLASVETVIVDEVHAVARDKRGAHLALSLERLEALARRRPQRIGLSATVNPIEEMARFLVGSERADRGGRPRCAIVETGRRRAFDLGIEIPADELSSVASNDLWRETYDRVAALVREHRSTLVFVNTRRIAERATHALAERLGEDAVAAHHGSLSRARRLRAEERLKAGDLRAVVATASLELGIDVGEVDLVVQLGTPGALHVALQRVGPRRAHEGGRAEGPAVPDEPRRAPRVPRRWCAACAPACSRRSASPTSRSTCSRSRSWRRRPPRRSTSTGSSRSSAAPGPTAPSRAPSSTRSSTCSRRGSPPRPAAPRRCSTATP